MKLKSLLLATAATFMVSEMTADAGSHNMRGKKMMMKNKMMMNKVSGLGVGGLLAGGAHGGILETDGDAVTDLGHPTGTGGLFLNYIHCMGGFGLGAELSVKHNFMGESMVGAGKDDSFEGLMYNPTGRTGLWKFMSAADVSLILAHLCGNTATTLKVGYVMRMPALTICEGTGDTRAKWSVLDDKLSHGISLRLGMTKSYGMWTLGVFAGGEWSLPMKWTKEEEMKKFSKLDKDGKVDKSEDKSDYAGSVRRKEFCGWGAMGGIRVGYQNNFMG